MIHRTTHLLDRLRSTVPSDVVAGAVATLLVDVALLSVPLSVFSRTLVALPLLFFLPGYFFVAALFPRTTASYANLPWLSRPAGERQLDVFERLALSYGVSLALLPASALCLSVTPWGVTAASVVTALSGVVFVCAPVAAVRRDAVPEEERFALPIGVWLSTAARGVTGGSVADAVVNVGLAAVVVSALAVTGGVVLSAQQQSDFTELAVLTENAQGDLVAGGYPDALAPGESVPLVLSVRNEGDRPVSYTVVVQVQRVGDDGGVLERKRLDRFQRRVAGGDSWRVEHDVSTSLVGDRLRLAYLLYVGEPPATPTLSNADRSVHIWLSVETEG